MVQFIVMGQMVVQVVMEVQTVREIMNVQQAVAVAVVCAQNQHIIRRRVPAVVLAEAREEEYYCRHVVP